MKKQNIDLEITFKYANVTVLVDPTAYDKVESLKIQDIVKKLSREITIDKTYVNYTGTKYQKTFITEDGWEKLCDLLISTKFGRKTSKRQYVEIHAAYYLLIVSYLYLALEDFGFSNDGIVIELKDRTYYMVEVTEDTYQEYRRYPGKWQLW